MSVHHVVYDLISREELDARIKGLGLSRRGLARAASCGSATTIQLANGARTYVSKRIATAIERELRVEPGTLFRMRRLITDSRVCGNQRSQVAA